jgi:hypothetical protein
MAKDKAEETNKAVGAAAATSAAAAASAPRPKLRYQDIPDLPETFVDSIGQWIFDGQMLRIEFTVTRLDPTASGPPVTGRMLPAARLVLTPACAIQLIRQSQQLMAALEKAAAAQQQTVAGKASAPSAGA